MGVVMVVEMMVRDMMVVMVVVTVTQVTNVVTIFSTSCPPMLLVAVVTRSLAGDLTI